MRLSSTAERILAFWRASFSEEGTLDGGTILGLDRQRKFEECEFRKLVARLAHLLLQRDSPIRDIKSTS